MSKKETVVLLLVILPLMLLGINGALHLLSEPNDMLVYAGYGVLIVWFAALYLLCARYGKILYTKVKAKNAALLCLCFLNVGCYKIVEPGHVGLLVKQTGGDRGVQDYPIQSGRVFYNPFNEDVYEWPTNVQRLIWTAHVTEGSPTNEEITFQSKEGLSFTADVNAAYQMQREKVPHFYVQFRTEDMNAFSHGFFRDAVRNAFNISTNYTAEEINGAKQTDLVNAVQEIVKAKMAPYGVDVIQVGFAAPPRPPDQVRAAIHNKIAAIQKSEQTEFEKRAAVAEGEKVKALAEAYAESNKVTNASLTPALIEWEKIKKWDGHNSQVVSGSGGVLVNVK